MRTNDEKLHLWEKVPLALLMAAQALVVFRWYAGDGLPALVQQAMPWVTTLFAVAAAVALDLVVVTTTMGRRKGRESIYGMLTAASAAVFSALVALDVYGVFPFGAWLHAAFPITTFVYAQHLAVRVQPVQENQENMDTANASDGTVNDKLGDAISVLTARIEALESMPTDANRDLAYSCPHCSTTLPNKQAKASAVSHGYCRHCKPAVNGHSEESFEDMEVIA